MELVCPAGSMPALKAAVDNGADAVYLGFRDGTNARRISPENRYYSPYFALSPDGKWILARSAYVYGIEVVQVSNGASIPVALSSDLYEPSWR